MNLRVDGTFAEDAGWHEAARRYEDFLRTRLDGRRVLFLELGVGGNTPGIIKYPFWRMCAQNAHARYACVNLGEAWVPEELRDSSILLNADIAEVLRGMRRL